MSTSAQGRRNGISRLLSARAEKKAKHQLAKDLARAQKTVRRLQAKRVETEQAAARELQRAEEDAGFGLARHKDLDRPSLWVFWDRVKTPEGIRPLTPDLKAKVKGHGRTLAVTIEGHGWRYKYPLAVDAAHNGEEWVSAFNRLAQAVGHGPPPAVAAARERFRQAKRVPAELQAAWDLVEELQEVTPIVITAKAAETKAGDAAPSAAPARDHDDQPRVQRQPDTAGHSG